MRIVIALLATLASQAVSTSRSPAETITFGGLKAIAVGDRQAEVVAGLRQSFIVEPIPNSSGTPMAAANRAAETACADRSTWIVYEKEAPRYMRGNVAFCAGRLESASKDWLLVESAGTAADVVTAIHSLFTQMNGQHQSCTLESRTNVGPGVEAKHAIVKCGRKSVGISVISGASGVPTVRVEEQVR